MAAAPVSKAELAFTLQALRSEGVRIDGRPLTACRRLSIRFGAAHGEVEVSFGPTRVLAVCSGEIITPPLERPNEGRIAFHVEYGPIASPVFEPGRPSVHATTTANLIERLIRGSRAVDAEALCIVGGQKVWSIRVDVRALDDDGNLSDACAVAALCSLLHFRKAEVEVKGETATAYAVDERVPVPLSIHHLPVPVTFGLFAPPPPLPGNAGKRQTREITWIMDPNRLEEAAMDGPLCIAVNQHGELCGVHKPGGLPIEFSLVTECTEQAVARAKEITARIQAELEADLSSRQLVRRNVHQQFAEDQLLTVDWGGQPAEVPAAPRRGRGTTVAAEAPATRAGKRAASALDADAGLAPPAAAAGEAASPGLGGLAAAAPASVDDGRDIEAELAAVRAEAAELEEQLAAAESAAGAVADGAEAEVAADADGGAAVSVRKVRKKRRTR